MTLSRRDEFAARAMVVMMRDSTVSHDWVAQESRIYADALIAELDHTAPKEAVPEVVDDGREIRCASEEDDMVTVCASFDGARVDLTILNMAAGLGRLKADMLLTPSDARLFAQRILKVCDEVEGK